MLNEENLIQNLSKYKIKQLIQIGANDGIRFDYLNKFIKKNRIKAILVEPIKNNFDALRKTIKNLNLLNLKILQFL